MSNSTRASSRVGDVRALSDDALMALARDLSARRRLLDAQSAEVAGELARRSDVTLGYAGLAQRLGARTPEKLVSRLTGVSVTEARSMVTVGSMRDDWSRSLVDGVAAGDVGVGTAAAIKAGLGEPNDDVTAAELQVIARKLATEAVDLAPEEASKRARAARDELDQAGIADRERALREKRYLHTRKLADGSLKIDALLDPESAAYFEDAMDRVTMPRRGGPRFVHPAEQERAEAASGDTRTLAQMMVDALVQIVMLAAGADNGTVFGTKAPAVRMHVRLSDFRAGVGAGRAEGQSTAFSIGTVERFVCQSGVVPILFDDTGQAINVGREFRTFTPRQRIAIAARDGGCMVEGCDRPPSWTEAHHCEPWSEGGATDVVNAISLCRHHHMWLHDTGRWIRYVDGQYLLFSPGGGAPETLRSKHPLQRRDHVLSV